MADGVDIESQEELTSLLVGRTIQSVEREPDSGESWPMDANTVTLWLDDGSHVTFIGIGYDSSACVTTYYPAAP